MKHLLLLLLLLPFFGQAQEKPEEVTPEQVQSLYDALPKQDGKVQWFEKITLDSLHTKDLLNKNAEAVFDRLLHNGREITRTEGKKDGKISGIGTFVVDGGAQNTLFGRVEESREVDFTLEIVFRDGGYSYSISDVTSIRQRNTARSSDHFQQTNFDQLTLEQAYKMCNKSGSKKLERRAFYQTIEKLTSNIELIKLMMKN